MGSVTIDLQEYNKLRDANTLLEQMRLKQVIVTKTIWSGTITTIIESKDEALVKLAEQLADAEFNLQMTRERLSELKTNPGRKKWFGLW